MINYIQDDGNSQIENIKISECEYIIDVEKFLEICEIRTKDGVPSVLSEGCKERLELYKKAINDTRATETTL